MVATLFSPIIYNLRSKINNNNEKTANNGKKLTAATFQWPKNVHNIYGENEIIHTIIIS